MARSAKRPKVQPKQPHAVAAATAKVAGIVSRNPALVGGSTAFLVALSFVSANALWYQPFAHPDAFFVTREIERGEALPARTETTINIERPEQPAMRKIEGDPVTKAVQAVLKDLNLYQGTVDGLQGPNTRKAVEAYQKTVGLPVTGMIDESLLEQLDTNPTAAIRSVASDAVPAPSAKPRPEASIEDIIAEPAAARFNRPEAPDAERIRKLQSGLKQAGRSDIEVDGIMGSRTRAALEEFQARYGLRKTGKADEEVFAAMRKKGLLD